MSFPSLLLFCLYSIPAYVHIHMQRSHAFLENCTSIIVLIVIPFRFHLGINVSTDPLKWRLMLRHMWESMLRQIFQVHVTSNTQNIKSSDWPKWLCTLWRNVNSHFLSDITSFQTTLWRNVNSHFLSDITSFQTTLWRNVNSHFLSDTTSFQTTFWRNVNSHFLSDITSFQTTLWRTVNSRFLSDITSFQMVRPTGCQ